MSTEIVVLDHGDTLRGDVAELVADLDVEVTVRGLTDATALARTVRPPSVVVVGPGFATAAGLSLVERQVRHVPGLQVVLAFVEAPDVPVADLIGTGASALVDPGDEWELRATISAAVDRTRALREILTSIEAGAVRAPKVFTVCSPTGGCGKTFYASNLAYLLATTSTLKVALVDLDLQFGEVTAAMRVRSQHTVADAVDIHDDRELDEMLPELLVEHDSGVLVLPAPRDPAIADTIAPQDVTRIVDALTRQVDVVVIDTPTGLTEPVLAALDASDHLFLVAALDLASLRNLRLFTETLDRLQIRDDHISLVLNKEASDTGIDVRDLDRVFPRGFASRVPFDREVARLMNQGTPVLEGAPTSAVAAAIVEGLLGFLDTDAAAAARARFVEDTGGLFRRIRERLGGSRDEATTPTFATVTGGN